jgi:hypothetical protein
MGKKDDRKLEAIFTCGTVLTYGGTAICIGATALDVLRSHREAELAKPSS